MSSYLLEKLTNGLEVSIGILGDGVGSSKTPTFGEYLKSVLDDLDMSASAVEKRSKEEAERRGLDTKAYTISDATIANILADVPSNHMMSKLCGLAWAINRPIEHVVAHAFGFAHKLSEFQKSDAFRLWDSQQKLTGEEARYYAKRIADLKNEVDQKVRLTKKPPR